MAHGVAEIHEAPFGKQDEVVHRVVAAEHLMHLVLHFLPAPVVAHVGGVDLVVEVADVADDGAALEARQHGRVADARVAGAGHQQIRLPQQPAVDVVDAPGVVAVEVGRDHLEAVHAGLHGADRIHLHDARDHPLLAQARSGALADVAVADHQGALASEQHVGRPLHRVVQAVAAAVAVVVLGLGHRVVHVDRRNLQLVLGEHVQQTMHAGGGLLAHAVDAVEHLRMLVVDHLRQVAAVVEQ